MADTHIISTSTTSATSDTSDTPVAEITPGAKESSRRILNYIHAILVPLVQTQFSRFHHSVVEQNSCLLALPVLEAYFNSCAEALTGGNTTNVPGGYQELVDRFDSFKIYCKHPIDVLDDIQTICISLMKHVALTRDDFEQQIIDYLRKHYIPLAQSCMLTCTIEHPVCTNAYQFVVLVAEDTK